MELACLNIFIRMFCLLSQQGRFVGIIFEFNILGFPSKNQYVYNPSDYLS